MTRTALTGGEIDLALSSLDRSLALDPDQAEAWVLPGEVASTTSPTGEMAVGPSSGPKLDPDDGIRLVRARQRPLLPRQGR